MTNQTWHAVQANALNGSRRLAARPNLEIASAQLRTWMRDYLASHGSARLFTSGTHSAVVLPDGRVPVNWYLEPCQVDECSACGVRA